MTEEEAKTKWCPYANVYIAYGSTGAGGNRGLGASSQMQDWKGNALCIGSACMAWRIDTRSAVKSRKDGSVRMLSPGDTYDPGAEIHFEAYDKTSGYCGLAGKP